MVVTLLVSGKLFLADEFWIGALTLLFGISGAVRFIDKYDVKVVKAKDLQDLISNRDSVEEQ